MNNSIKILLTINLEGGALVRQSKPSFISWSINERDLNPEKNWKEGEGYNVVKRGISKHNDLEGKGTLQRIKITKEAFDTMISSNDCPENVNNRIWNKMSKIMRLEYHLYEICNDVKGYSFSYEILEDE